MPRLPKPIIRPATREDIARFFKGKYPFTSNAIVGVVRGRVIGIGGVGYVPTTEGRRLVAFCDLKPSARRYKVTLVKAAAQIIETAKANGAKYIYAEADPKEPGAVRWITSLGFKPTALARIYRWAWKD